MALDSFLLSVLACPVTKQPVALADAALVTRLNAAIAAGTVKNVGGALVSEAVDTALVRSDRAVLYPVREDIPVMLPDEGIALSALTATPIQ